MAMAGIMTMTRVPNFTRRPIADGLTWQGDACRTPDGRPVGPMGGGGAPPIQQSEEQQDAVSDPPVDAPPQQQERPLEEPRGGPAPFAWVVRTDLYRCSAGLKVVTPPHPPPWTRPYVEACVRLRPLLRTRIAA